jgi:glutaredoxin
MKVILDATDTKYGILSCNSPSTALLGSTLAEFVLQKGVTNTSKGRTIVSRDNALNVFRNIHGKNRQKFTDEATNNIAVDIKYNMLNPSSGRSLQLRVLQQEKILEIYAELTSMDTKYIKDMTLTEKNIVIERLMMLYRQGKLDKEIEGFDDKMEEIFLNQMTTDSTTVQNYIESRMSANKNSVIVYMIGFMNDGLKKRLKEPGFIETLTNMNTDIELVVPETSDEDVLERLNIYLLNKYKTVLERFNIVKNGIFKKIDPNQLQTHIQNTIRGIMNMVLAVTNYINHKRTMVIEITDVIVGDILDIAFPYCSEIPLVGISPPPIVFGLCKGTPFASSGIASILWKYYMLFITVNGFDYQNSKTEMDLVTRIGYVGDIYIDIIPAQRSTQELLEFRQRQDITRGNIIIYSIDGCDACISAKKKLDEWYRQRGSKTQYKSGSSSDIPDSLMSKITNSDGSVSFPVIVVGDELIDGNRDLDRILNSTPIRATRRK